MKFIVIGASHASRTADALAATGVQVVKLVQPGWCITKTRVAELADQLKTALENEGDNCTVVYQILINNNYLARTEEGGLVPICTLTNTLMGTW